MKKRILSLVLSATLALSPVHAQFYDLPDLGDVASSALSTLDEQRLGDSIMRDIRWRDRDYLDDPEIESYVNRLGMRLAAASANPDRPLSFFVIRDPSINAFALPGGYIGLHSGLILTAESESELASVIGHEIAHVTQRHIAQLFGKQGQASMVMLASLLVAVLAARSGSQVSEAALAAGQAGAIQSQIGYTRAFEREADRLGLLKLEAAGFDVRGMPSFFERLQRTNRIYENNAPGYLRTHPLTQERIADMQNRVEQMPYRQVLDSSDFAYVRAKLRAMDGLASTAVRYFEARSQVDWSNRYGLARALLRAARLEEAATELSALQAGAPPSPFIDLLAAELALATGKPGQAVATLETAVERYPDHLALQYALIDALLRGERAAEAAALARRATVRDPQDARFWILSSRAERAAGRIAAHHRAQAEVYVRQGSLPAAIEQLEFARRSQDVDFFDGSAIDARARELKRALELERAERR